MTSSKVEVRQHADGRVAMRLPEPVDDVTKGLCHWMAFGFGTEPQHHLNVALLTDDEVKRDGWTPSLALDEHSTQRLAERLYRDYDSEYEASHLTWQNFTGDARRYIGALTQTQDPSTDEPQ